MRRVRYLLIIATLVYVFVLGFATPAIPERDVECSKPCADYVTGVLVAYVRAVEQHNVEVVARHYDPFLVCTRAHESDTAGGYAAVNSTGTYRGAYQFARSTWDATAEHFGHWWLVGDDPAAATVADQDLQAMRLYEWQGASPWLGRCA